MELIKYVRTLRRWLVLILLAPVLAGVAAGVTSVLLPPVYEARVSLLVRPSQPLSSDATVQALTTDQVSRTYAQLMTEPPLLAQVISDEHLRTTPDSLAKQVTVVPEPNTTILDVKVQNHDPALARDIANTLVTDFLQEIKQIEATENETPTAQSHDNLVIVAPATRPDHPVFPNLPLNISVSVVAGLILGLGIAFVLDYLDQSVKADDDLTRAGLIPLGHVPFVPAGRARGAELLALTTADDTPATEAYRSLRTNVLFSGVDRDIRTIVVTSALPGEGKSRTAANLSIVLAQAGYKTLLIDCDFRRPSQHRMFGRLSNLGLANLILKDKLEADVIHPVAELSGLWLLPSGPIPPNPSELLGSGRMQELMAHFRQAFQYVIVDSPPVNLVTDATVVAARSDLVLLVAAYAETTIQSLRQAQVSLSHVGAHIAGAVLNKIKSEPGGYGQPYGNYGYTRVGSGGKASKTHQSRLLISKITHR